ncbi:MULTISPECIES: DUF3939 domain-containing protein [Paenibacillus]|jgi:hypothetical protein|uniref:DUF3939 domain-containing protein n=1 Tax=Paenibacillus odorifer TaxID=189426 RepID=A0A1R0WRK4_9BACL|nr:MULTISPECIES: DUF3939 domain-containing protein [Paenibacillus]AIQ74842.1 hypothetical protein PODO_17135 [Paenibacillus odorifer]AWV34161.1 hypothetical protein CD191_16935 [Paenibacillus odorifer]ETT46306.1 hypothetical protein C171_28662 [Paenibacillus sp. FSL H8-237]MDH6428410.1 hypothetical protein [Paenibacillus sp. PastH-4]MDH6443956.1 hypothetical protein [Paenibacillus sp. PastF-4]
MLFKRTKKQPKSDHVTVTLPQVKQAIRKFEEDMPGPINRTALILEDKRIDMSRLKRYLGGIPERNFYMSRETYEIFEEEDKLVPYYLDLVQAAVDSYISDTGKLPLLEDTWLPEVHYRLLSTESYLKETPPFPLYITDEEMMLTHRAEHFE